MHPVPVSVTNETTFRNWTDDDDGDDDDDDDDDDDVELHVLGCRLTY